jgi:NitT/TauT family transport system ATP-binding protein
MTTRTSPGHLLEVSGLSVRYKIDAEHELKAIQNIDLYVDSGEFVSIVGPSGCGKSTLLSVISGIVPARDGTVRVKGAVVERPGPDRAMVFQDPRLLPWRAVLGNVLLPLEAQGVRASDARRRGMAEIKRVGLDGFESFYPNQLSGGMRQRVNMARALALEPLILLLDEPFASLDAQSREYMQEELLRIWEDRKATAILVTHQIDEAVFLSDRVFVMTNRPGMIRSVHRIELPRPRTLGIKRTPEFHRYTDAIWQEIELPKSLLDEQVGTH